MNMFVILFLMFMLMGCTVSKNKVIYFDKAEEFIDDKDFNAFSSEEYKILDAIILPFFLEYDQDIYTGYLGGFVQQEGYGNMHVFSYIFTFYEDGNKIKISEVIDKKVRFEDGPQLSDGLKYPYADVILFDKKELVLDENRPITLEIDVSVSRNGVQERKTINYNLKFRVDKYYGLNIRGW